MRTCIKILFLLNLFIVNASLTAQIPGVKHFKIDEGSEQIKIVNLFKNKQGYIYAGTSKGLYKFDGIKFSKIPFQNPVNDPHVTAIFQDVDMQLWVGFKNGDIAKLTNNYLKFFTPEEGTPKKPITAFLQDRQKNLWFSTDGEGVYYISNNHLYNFNTADGLSDNGIYTLALTNDGKVLAGTDQGISICTILGNKKSVKKVTSLNGLPDNFVKVIIPAGNNNFWIGMQDKGVCLYNSSANRFTVPGAFSSWQYGQINQLMLLQNNLWIATEDSGLIKASGANSFINNIEIEYGKSSSINDIIQDNEGNVWMISNGDELVKTSGSQLKLKVAYTKNDFEKAHAILHDNQNNIWQATEQGLIKHESPDKRQNYFIKELDAKTDITALYQDINNNIWIGTMGKGIFLLDPKKGNYRNINENILLKKGSILSINGKGNTVFVSSLEGAEYFTVNSQTSIYNNLSYNTFSDINSIGSNYIYNIFKDSKNRIWFATDGKGITVLQDNIFTNYNEKQGLKDEVIYSITEDHKGNIWFSTHSTGVYKFDGKKFTNYSTANGLSDINISAVKTNKAGNIMIVYKKGIDVLNPETGKISYLNNNQGIKEINVQDLGSVSQDTSGGIVFSTSDGIMYYNPVPNAIQQPQTILENASLFLQPVNIANAHTFNHNENSFSFSFIGLYYTNPEAVQYQYKLDGYNNEWINTKDRNINFPQLPPGKYTFRVRSSINQIFNGTIEASYEFKINHPFWVRWWFIISSILITGGLIYWYIKNREKSVKKVERLQQEKIQFQFETLRNQVNPHFLFNSFNTLISIIEDDPKLAVEYVEQLSDFFRNIVNYRDRDTIPLKEELGLLQTYLFIQQKRFGKSLRLNITLSEEEKATTYIPPLTLQLLGENAIKHNAVSKETPLTIKIFIENGRLIVENNINAKLNKAAGAGMGLQNIVNRYTLLSKQNVIIENNKNNFVVSLPILNQKL